MTDAPDLEELARRYLDLWQDQTAAVMNDPTLAEAMGRAYALMTSGGAGLFGAVPRDGFAKGAGHSSNDSANTAAVPSGTPAAAASPADPGLDPAHLARRVAALEERLRRLEAALGSDSRGAEAPTRRRRR